MGQVQVDEPQAAGVPSATKWSVVAIRARSVAGFTATSVTPGTRESTFYTRLTQAAQVMPGAIQRCGD